MVCRCACMYTKTTGAGVKRHPQGRIGQIICVEVSGRKEGSHTLLHLVGIHGDMVVVGRRRADIVVLLLDHLLVSIAFLNFVSVPMAVFVVGQDSSNISYHSIALCRPFYLPCVQKGPLFLFYLIFVI